MPSPAAGTTAFVTLLMCGTYRLPSRTDGNTCHHRGMSTSGAAKPTLRTAIRESRRARPAEDRTEAGIGLARVLESAPEFARATTVTAYASFGTEPETAPLLSSLVAAGKRVLLPIVHDDGSLGWVDYTGPESLSVSERGIPEPVGVESGRGAQALANAHVDVMLIPALAVDESGARIGKGGGFYDRVLAELPSHRPIRIAVVFDDDLLGPGSVPVESYDRPVHAALTPTRLQRFP